MTSATLSSKRAMQRVVTRGDNLAIVLAPYRVVLATVLGSIWFKGLAYPAIFSAYLSCQITDEFFPGWLTNAYVLAGFIVLPSLILVAALVTRRVIVLRIQALIVSACMFGMCIHQGSYNDATFVTCFWVSLWCLWFTMRINDPVDILSAKARSFAILIISVIFLGGAVGKLTPGYWSGEIFYQIYFVDRDFWCFNLLRNWLEPESLRWLATIYSRMVIVVELGCALLWLLRPRMAATIALGVLLCLTLFSNVNLFSVTLCLMGLCLFVLHEGKKTVANLGNAKFGNAKD